MPNALLALLLMLPAAASEPCIGASTCLELRVHVATADGAPVVDAAWLEAQRAEADRHFAPLGVAFVIAEVPTLPEGLADVVTRADRDLLGRGRLSPGRIDVFVVRSLADVDVPGEVIRGVHWRDRQRRTDRWILLSAIAPAKVLAHELGHYFGLPHSTDPRSLMNKTPRVRPPPSDWTFTPPELSRMKRRLKALLRAGDLVPTPAR